MLASLNPRSISLWIVTFFLTICSEISFGDSSDVAITDTPDWVESPELIISSNEPYSSIEGGIYYLLLDRQMLVPEKGDVQSYQYFAEKIINQQGVERASQVSVDFDPSYQTLELHSIQVYRDGEATDRLSDADISILQRETELEYQLYNGQHTATIILDDIRVGDIVAYSYTKLGQNPVYKHLFSITTSTQWSVPLDQQSFRLIWQKLSPLYIHQQNRLVDIKEDSTDLGIEYSFVNNQPPPIKTNSGAPANYSPYGEVMFTDLKSWAEVVLWEKPMYDASIAVDSELETIASEIMSNAADPKDRVVKALQFVQSEVRYFGVELGQNSHFPSLASETLARRYGDCKDKVVLLISLLKQMGIEASPALVDTTSGLTSADEYVQRDAFDHVIVKLELDGSVYWLDPTRQYQRGILDNVYQPDYGFSLVLADGVTSLESMSGSTRVASSQVYERFELQEAMGDVKLEVRTTTRGWNAEDTLYGIAESGPSELSKDYRDFYASYYGTAQIDEPYSYEENELSGEIEEFESYVFTDFWEEEANGMEAGFYATGLRYLLDEPDELVRNTPYALDQYSNLDHLIHIYFSRDNWSFDREDVVEDNKFFVFSYTAEYDAEEKLLALHYKLSHKVAEVSVADFDDYMKARERAYDLTYYGIIDYYDTPASEDSPGDSIADDVMVYLFLALIACYLISLIAAVIIWLLRKQKQLDQTEWLFAPTSPIKFYLLTVATFEIYAMYWCYRNWTYIKRRDESSIMPFWRALFSVIWFYPLCDELIEDSQKRFESNRALPQWMAGVFAVLYLILSIASNGDSIWSFVALILIPLVFLPQINYINYVNQRLSQDNTPIKSPWSKAQIAIVVFFLPMIVVIFGSESNLLANENVIDGDKIWAHDISFMIENNILDRGESIELFYSAAMLSIREDGNGFSDRQVFSYWKDNNGLNLDAAKFSEVQDIDIVFSESWDEDSVITITLNDGSDFILYVSSGDGRDKEFFRVLKQRWRAVNASIQ